MDKTDNFEDLFKQAELALETQAMNEAEEESERVKAELELRAVRKAIEEERWMQEKTGPSGMRIAEITDEAVEMTSLGFEEQHTRNGVHMVGKQEETTICTVITTVAKCFIGGGDRETSGNAYPAQLSMERVGMIKTLVRRRQRLREITGGSKCMGIDVQELVEISEEEFERKVQEVATVQKMQTDAAKAKEEFTSSSMDWLCNVIRTMCAETEALY